MMHEQDTAARTDTRSQGRPYTWRRMPPVGQVPHYRVITPDGRHAYMVTLGGGFGRCNCPGFRKYDRCRHLPAMERALEREPFASHGDLDTHYGPEPPEGRPYPRLPDEVTLALRFACETALNYLHRLRIADLQWRRHEDLQQEADSEVIPLLRNAVHRSRDNS